MSGSDTVIAALKFQGGVLLGADSQVSDPMNQVRWLMQKPQRCGQHPLVAAFSGSKGQGVKAQEALAEANFHTTSFARRDRVEKLVISALQPVYERIAAQSKPPPGVSGWEIALLGLMAFYSEGDGQILECIANGDTEWHDSFHSLGSGSNTAYAVYRTLGGSRLAQLDQDHAIWALLRILRTAISVEVAGVGEPVVLYVITEKKTFALTEDELQPHLEAVANWEEEDRERFFKGAI